MEQETLDIQEMPAINEEEEEQQMPTLQPAVQLCTTDQTDQTTLTAASETQVLPVTNTEQSTKPKETVEEARDAVGGACTETDSSIPPIACAACHLPIKDKYLLQAMDHYWHEDCLKCSCCDCRLGEVGATLYTKAHLLLCKRDYLRLFGASGACTICKKTIPAFEMVMKVKTNVYHLECFACQQCRQRFCVGDKFYLCENRVLCEYDFEEQNLITSIQRGYNTLSHMRKQTETLSDISSGYGSPSPGTM